MTVAQSHPPQDRRCLIGGPNRYPERNVARKRPLKRRAENRRVFAKLAYRLVGGSVRTATSEPMGVTAGRDRHFSSLNWRRAGLHLVRAPRRAFSGKAA